MKYNIDTLSYTLYLYSFTSNHSYTDPILIFRSSLKAIGLYRETKIERKNETESQRERVREIVRARERERERVKSERENEIREREKE